MPFVEPSSIQVFLLKLERRITNKPMYRQYVESLGLKGNERVIEYGSGSGHMSQYLADTLKTGHLTCVDISTVWMGIVKEKMAGYSNVDFKLGDIETLDIEDNAYDVAVASYIIHDIHEDRQEKVSALVKKLKNGGIMYVREPSSSGHGMPPEEVRRIMKAAGLKELSSKAVKRTLMGPYSQWTFIKAS